MTDKPTQVGGLPEPAFRIRWDGMRAAYYVSKPNVGDTDVYTADQMHACAQANVQAEREKFSQLEARLVALEKKWRDESVSGFDGNGNLSDTWTAQAMRFCADELTALLESTK